MAIPNYITHWTSMLLLIALIGIVCAQPLLDDRSDARELRAPTVLKALINKRDGEPLPVRTVGGVQTYSQNIKVRFLQPPPVPPPGPLRK